MALPIPTGRNMVILPRLRAMRHGVGGALLEPLWPDKDPASTGFYGVDWYWVFDGAAPVAVTAALVPSDALTVLSQGIVGTAYVLELSGGADGSAASVLLTATGPDGRIEVRAVSLRITGEAVVATETTVASVPSAPVALFTFVQSMPAAVWVIQHDLNRFPSVTVIDAAGDEVEMDVRYIDPNTLTLTAAGALSGTAYLS